ncbi:CAP domain-containing protein [Metabacillus sp. GX 13764]|uniref:CAP domain-containing protein n=1 Tax=Metabacillus kandeliae TaxID=2900151 RepID=UPI001E2CE7F2|nr:CAP domain-containing protein [Metabacillus kandeliae]MCD7034481.1 CAP domain-containing protein [Metabacillus kandeliae]
MKKLALCTMAVAGLLFASQGNSALASTGSAAANEGASLQKETLQFGELIKKGDLYSINSSYDSFTYQLKQTENAIGKVAGQKNRDKLNETYVRPAKIAKERVIYEVSEYRLIHKTGIDLLNNETSLAGKKTRMLGRLAERAIQIKAAGYYASIPSAIPQFLSASKGQLDNGKFVDAGKGTVSRFDYEVFILTNMQRVKYKLSPLTLDVELSGVAKKKSEDMIAKGYFDHQSPTYGSPFQMMEAFHIPYHYAGENIAMGYRSPADVVQGWMNSKDHRENILKETYNRIGTGYSQNYWTQMFVGR